MATNCSNTFLPTSLYYQEIAEDDWLIAFLSIGSVLGVASIAIFLEELVFLYRTFTGNETKIRELATILGVYPMVCVLSVLSLLVPTCTDLVDLIISCYLSVCIYTFVHITIGHFGGDQAMIMALSEDLVQLNTPPLCCCCCCICRPIQLTKSSLRKIKLLTMQVAIVRPLLLFVSAVLWTDGRYVQSMNFDSPYIYITILTAISTLTSMYGKTIIYRASRAHLKHYKIVLKFISLQLMILILNLQHLIFNLLGDNDVLGCVGSRGPKVRARNFNHSVLILESFLLSWLARAAYRTDENISTKHYEVQAVANDDVKSGYTNEVALED